MSTNRRERRERQRYTEKRRRKLDWAKVRANLKWLGYGYLVLVIFCAILFVWSAWNSNRSRRKISTDPASAIAVVNEIHKTKNSNFATYTFHVSGQAYYGETGRRYNGVAGDSVDITYNRIQPSLNMPNNEMPEETLGIVLDEFKWMAMFLAGVFLLIPIITVVSIFFGDKAAYNDISSKVN